MLLKAIGFNLDHLIDASTASVVDTGRGDGTEGGKKGDELEGGKKRSEGERRKKREEAEKAKKGDEAEGIQKGEESQSEPDSEESILRDLEPGAIRTSGKVDHSTVDQGRTDTVTLPQDRWTPDGPGSEINVKQSNARLKRLLRIAVGLAPTSIEVQSVSINVDKIHIV